MALRAKHARFVDEFVIDLNATQAAIRAGYSKRSAKVTGSRLLTKADISAEIERKKAEIAAKSALSVQYVLDSLREVNERCRQAVPVFEWRNGERVATGEWEFDSAGANRSAELLGKHLGMFTDKLEANVQGGGPLTIVLKRKAS